MANELIKVELIANPAVTRLMTRASFMNNTHKWRAAGVEPATTTAPEKKSAAPVAEVKAPAIVELPAPTPQAETTEFVQDPSALPIEPQATGVIDGLRVQYKAITGKDADKRWGVKKLSEEIKTCRPTNH